MVAGLSVKTKTKEMVVTAALLAKMKGVGCCDWVQVSLNLISLRTFYYFHIQFKLTGSREN